MPSLHAPASHVKLWEHVFDLDCTAVKENAQFTEFSCFTMAFKFVGFHDSWVSHVDSVQLFQGKRILPVNTSCQHLGQDLVKQTNQRQKKAMEMFSLSLCLSLSVSLCQSLSDIAYLCDLGDLLGQFR